MLKCFKQGIKHVTFMFLVSRKTLKFHNNNCTLKCNLIKEKLIPLSNQFFTIDFFKKDYNNLRLVFCILYFTLKPLK